MELDLGGGYLLRHALESDHAAINMVCLKTGDSGNDATAREDDPDLLGLYYAVPYQVYEPAYAFVVDSPGGVCGYVFGALDSERFYEWMRREWLPPIAGRISDPGSDRSKWRGSDAMRHLIHHPNFIFPPAFDAYPSHGHIDLLAPLRGKGIGRRAMEHVVAALKRDGSTGIHLGVSPVNTSAQAFYRRLGFGRVTGNGIPADAWFMARAL